MYSKIKNSKSQSAFTIVELLVVIVIIGILAAIIFLAYTGVSQKAIDTSLQSDLKNASTILELDKTNDDFYPSTSGSANNNKGLKASSDTILNYAYNSADNSYCLTATKNGRSYYINSADRTPKYGSCPDGSIASSFTRTWGGTGNETGYSVIQTNDGGYIVAGSTESYGAGSVDLFIVKYTPSGNLSWSKTWGGTGIDYGGQIIQTSDGGYAVAGETNSYGSGNYDVFLTKFTSSGEASWSKTWDKAAYDGGISLVQTSDEGYAITGSTSDGSSSDLFIIKYTVDGDLSWVKTWGGGGDDSGYSITQTDDNGYVVAGETSSYGAGNYDALLIKFTAGGTLSWAKTWGGNRNDFANSVIQTADSGYAITGKTNSYGSNGDVLLAKFTADGTLSWNKTLDTIGREDVGNQIIQLNDSRLTVTGVVDTADHCPAAKPTDNHKIAMNNTTAVDGGSYIALTGSSGCSNNTGTDILLSKFSNSGELIWSNAWGESYDEQSRSVAQADDGGYVIAGSIRSSNDSDSDSLFIKYNSNGQVDGCSEPTCKDMTSSATITDPSAISNFILPEVVVPPMTITFSGQELYVAYPGASQTVCKEWTVPDGYEIKGFKASQATESGYDYFSVSLDGVEKYNKSGSWTDQYVDTSISPGLVLKACMSADDSVQNGYGGEVTGVVYGSGPQDI